MAGTAHFSSLSLGFDFKSGFWQMKMVPGSQPLPWSIWDFMNLPRCLFGCAMHLPP